MASSNYTSPLIGPLTLGLVVTLGTATLTQAADLYWDTNGAATGAGDTASPVGQWNATAPNWTSAAAGDASTQAWASGQTAVFSAGANATGNYTITVTGTQSLGGIRFEEGRPTITGGLLRMGTATISNTGAAQTYILSRIQGNGVLTLAGANQNYLTGVISDDGGARSIVMESGQWVFSGAHTYSGGTTINAGEAAVTVDSSSPGGVLTSGPFGTGVVYFNGGIMRPSSTVSRTVANPVVFGGDVSLGMTYYTATLTLTGPLTLTGNRVLTVNNASASGVVSFDGILGEDGGSFGFTKTGNAVLSLNASNTFTGGVTVNSGTLRIGHAGALNATTPNAVAFASNSTGTLQLDGHSVTVAGLSTNATTPGTTVVENGSDTNAILTVGNPAENTFAGVLRDGTSGTLGLTKSNAGLLVLSGPNTYSGNTTVTGGILRANDGVGLPSGANKGNLTLNGGVFETGADLVRSLGSSRNEVQLTGGTSGFSAHDGPVTIALGGLTSPTALTWGSESFNPTTLVLNDTTATNALNFTNAIDLNGDDRIIAVRASTATLSGHITGDGAVTKTGLGLLTLTNTANNFGGLVTIHEGTLSVGDVASAGTACALGAGSSLAIGNAITSGALQFTGASGVTNRSITLGSAGGAINVSAATGNLTLSGPISGGSLTKTGLGILKLTNANDYSGVTNVQAGVLNVRNANALGTTNAGTVVADGARLELQGNITVSGETITLAGNGSNYFGALQSASGDNAWDGAVILNAGGDTRIGANAGTLTIRGAIQNGTSNLLRIRNNTGTTILAGANTYTGGTDVMVGALKIAEGDNRLPVGTTLTLGVNGPVTGLAATFDLNGQNQTVANLVLAGLADSAVTNTGSTASTFTVDNASSSAYGGRITNGPNPLHLVKAGLGVFRLTNTSATAYDYTGATEINAGTLALAAGVTIANSPVIKLATSTAILDVTAGGLTLASGQTLSGLGAVAGSLTVAAGSTLSPGLSPGTLTTGSETWASGGSYLWEIDDAAGTAGDAPGWDLLAIQGDLTITATADNPFNVNITSLLLDTNMPGNVANFDNSAEYTWTIAQYSGSFAMTGEDDFASRFNLVNNFSNALGEGTFLLVHDANQQRINLVFSSSHVLVPEPASLVLLGLGLGIVVVQRRRRSH